MRKERHMFRKGTMKQQGLDITIKNNPRHVLAPDDWEKVMAVRLGRMGGDEYTEYYKGLLRGRWETRRDEFINLAREGMEKEVVLKCFCPDSASYCHAHTAAKFMNGLVNKLQARKEQEV